jgi:hypothetical protein
MLKCPNAKMPKCQNAKMPKMPKCQNDKMTKCQNDKMTKCFHQKYSTTKCLVSVSFGCFLSLKHFLENLKIILSF